MNERVRKKRAKTKRLGVVLPPLTPEQKASLFAFAEKLEAEFGPFEPPRFVFVTPARPWEADGA